MTLTTSPWPPGGARVILSILSIWAGQVPDEISFIFFRSGTIRKLIQQTLNVLDNIILS